MDGKKVELATEIKRVEIPENITNELERLHSVLVSSIDNEDDETKKWAISKIDNIHKCYFEPKWITK